MLRRTATTPSCPLPPAQGNGFYPACCTRPLYLCHHALPLMLIANPGLQAYNSKQYVNSLLPRAVLWAGRPKGSGGVAEKGGKEGAVVGYKHRRAYTWGVKTHLLWRCP